MKFQLGEESQDATSSKRPENRSTREIPEQVSVTRQSPEMQSAQVAGHLTMMHHQSPRVQRPQMAPLASLDCSITEPIDEEKAVTPTGSPSPKSQATNTPTLSGYFDCDQLSDMVDDSLFEITNAGCLSKSVFGHENRATFNGYQLQTGGFPVSFALPLAPPKQPVAPLKQEPVTSNGYVTPQAPIKSEENEEEDSESGRRTPTNEEEPAAEAKAEPPLACCGGPLTSYRKLIAVPSQAAMVATHQPYDYSATSSVPAQTRAMAPAQVSGNDSAGYQQPAQVTSAASSHRQRSRSARYPSSSSSSAATAIAAKSATGNRNEPPSARGRPKRKSRSQTDVRQEATGGERSTMDQETGSQENYLCAECRLAETGSNRQRDRSQQQQKQEKKRGFHFSLWNLFGGGGSSGSSSNNSDTLNRNDKISSKSNNKATGCSNCGSQMEQSQVNHPHQSTNHDRRGSSTNRRKSSLSSSSASASSNNRGSSTHQEPATRQGVSESQIKSRDSIRIMNQRRQRQLSQGSATGLRLSNTIADFQQPQTKDTELLLTLSSKQQPLRGACANNQSSYSVLKAINQAEGNCRLRQQQQPLLNNQLPRQTKSVKFKMEDKVMIVPASNNEKSTSGASNLPPADRQPAAPIIKRQPQAPTQTGNETLTAEILPTASMQKASSYSQTDTNKNLEQLLAKYEVNNELVAEINERFKLVETIASPISALDQQQPEAASSIDQEEAKNFVDEQQETLRNQPSVPNGSLNNPRGQRSSSSESEDAGFSKDWLNKQQQQQQGIA